MSAESLGEALFPGQVGGKTIRFVEREPFIWLFSGCGCIICCDAIFLRTARRPMWQDGGWGGGEWWAPRHSQFCFADKLGQELKLRGEKSEEKKARLEAGRSEGGGGLKRETVQSPVARGHNLQHLLAMIDQRKRREGNGVCGLTRDEAMGWRRGLKSQRKMECESERGGY